MARRPYDRLTAYPRIIPYGQLPTLPLIQRYNPVALQYRQALIPRLMQSPIEICPYRDCPMVSLPHYIHECAHYYRCDNSRHESCSSSDSDEHRRGITFKTKDIVVRGKCFSVRASYCQDQPKFEKDLVSFVDKKSEKEVPFRVVDHLIAFINKEDYCNADPLDEITLCILASNVGTKSVMEHSLSRITKGTLDAEVNCNNVVDIILTILLSSDVPDKLTTWLQKYVRDYWATLFHLPDFQEKIVDECPGVFAELEKMMGLRVERDTERGRVI